MITREATAAVKAANHLRYTEYHSVPQQQTRQLAVIRKLEDRLSWERPEAETVALETKLDAAIAAYHAIK